MARPNSGMDPSPLLPLGVLMLVVTVVFVPLAFHAAPAVSAVRETAVHAQSFQIAWALPLIILAAVFLTSTELLVPTNFGYQDRPIPTATYYERRNWFRSPQYSMPRNQQSGEGPNWGLIALVLLTLMLLPWRY